MVNLIKPIAICTTLTIENSEDSGFVEVPPKLHQGMAVSVQFWGRDVDCILSELDDFSGEWWISLPNTSGSFTRVPTYRITSRKA